MFEIQTDIGAIGRVRRNSKTSQSVAETEEITGIRLRVDTFEMSAGKLN